MPIGLTIPLGFCTNCTVRRRQIKGREEPLRRNSSTSENPLQFAVKGARRVTSRPDCHECRIPSYEKKRERSKIGVSNPPEPNSIS